MYPYNWLYAMNMNNMMMNMLPMMPNMTYIRVFHASPDAPAVDIYANGNKLVGNLKFKDITPYVPVPEGNYNIQIFPAGEMDTPVISSKVDIPSGQIITVAAVGKLENLKLLPIIDSANGKLEQGKAKVKFVHLSPDAPAVDVALPDGTILFEDIEFREVSSYVQVEPGAYSVEVKPTGTEDVVLTKRLQLSPGTIYTVYAIGLVGGEPALDAVLKKTNTN